MPTSSHFPSVAPPVALDKAHAFTLWLVAKVNKMPRGHRFTIGDRLYCQSLDLLTALTKATFSRERSRALEAAIDRVNNIRILLRLAKDLGLVRFDSYTHACTGLDEIGRMVGGWRKAAERARSGSASPHWRRSSTPPIGPRWASERVATWQCSGPTWSRSCLTCGANSSTALIDPHACRKLTWI